MTSISLTIDGMHCNGCVSRVTAAIQKVGAIPEKVEIGRAVVRFADPHASPDALLAALDRMGFEAKVDASHSSPDGSTP